MQPEILTIIPARSGSLGVRNKNLQLLGGKPLISHSFDFIQDSVLKNNVIVASDSHAILGVAENHGYQTFLRNNETANANQTIAELVILIVKELNLKPNTIICVLQPTTPFRSQGTLTAMLDYITNESFDSVSTVTPIRKLLWKRNQENSKLTPLFEKRVNRQELEADIYSETGSIQLIKYSALLKHKDMVSSNHKLQIIEHKEALDIDSLSELYDARMCLSKPIVIFRIIANLTSGYGHLYHSILIAQNLQDCEVRFLIDYEDEHVTEKLSFLNYKYEVLTDLQSQLSAFNNENHKILVNDKLDTQKQDVLIAKQLGFRVVNIEDQGEGAQLADVVINELYDDKKIPSGHVGSAFATIRPEFFAYNNKNIRKKAKRILIAFGGTDPSRLTERALKALHNSPNLELVVITPSAERAKELENKFNILAGKDIAYEMFQADIIICSGGRTVHEAAFIGTPIVVLAQNAREMTHTHASIENGVINLGLGTFLSLEAIKNNCLSLLDNYQLRMELSKRLLNWIDGKGVQRVRNAILGEI